MASEDGRQTCEWIPRMPSAMTDSELPKNLLLLIQNGIPTLPAAELLVFLARHPEKAWKCEEIVGAIRPAAVTIPEGEKYLAAFEAQGLIRGDSGLFQFAPASPELKDAVLALVHAYDERPVTLIRTIYALADSKIQSFADSFKLNKDSP